MRTRVLLSIKPEFARRIFSGEKCFEYRRAIFRNQRVSTAVVYASSPIQRVIGEFQIARILSASPDELWRRTSESAGIEMERFFEYFDGCAMGYAIEVANPRRYRLRKTLDTAFAISTPPQSFCYV